MLGLVPNNSSKFRINRLRDNLQVAKQPSKANSIDSEKTPSGKDC